MRHHLRYATTCRIINDIRRTVQFIRDPGLHSGLHTHTVTDGESEIKESGL